MILQKNKVFFFFFCSAINPPPHLPFRAKQNIRGAFSGRLPSLLLRQWGQTGKSVPWPVQLVWPARTKKKMASCKPHTTFQGAHDARAQNTHGATTSHVSPSVFGVSQCTSVTCTDALASTHNKHAHNNSHMHFALFVFT